MNSTAELAINGGTPVRTDSGFTVRHDLEQLVRGDPRGASVELGEKLFNTTIDETIYTIETITTKH